jgi:hypothetical protein
LHPRLAAGVPLSTEALADSSQALNRQPLKSLYPRNSGFIEPKCGKAAYRGGRPVALPGGSWPLACPGGSFFDASWAGEDVSGAACTVVDGDAELGAGAGCDLEPDFGADTCRGGWTADFPLGRVGPEAGSPEAPPPVRTCAGAGVVSKAVASTAVVSAFAFLFLLAPAPLFALPALAGSDAPTPCAGVALAAAAGPAGVAGGLRPARTAVRPASSSRDARAAARVTRRRGGRRRSGAGETAIGAQVL